MKGQTAPAPIRGFSKKAGGGEAEGEEVEEQEEQEGGAGDMMDLLPRTDIRWVLLVQFVVLQIEAGSCINQFFFFFFFGQI